MAIDVGFFDAALDADGQYDRAYDSGAFTEYFAQFIGSGVCIYNNPDSMMVTLDATSKKVFINPGYLFIDGYWLKNSELYSMNVSSLADGTYAIAAILNLGRRTITLGTIEKADPETYPQTLVLAYLTVSGSSLSLQDTRENSDICGEIDSAGGLSNKVERALLFIDTEVDQKLDAAMAQINLASEELNSTLQEAETSLGTKLDEANQVISTITPPAIGTIRFSASQNVESGWLLCDGSFITEAQYPELVEALGKIYPSNDKFHLISEGEIGAQITNGVIYNNKMWVYSYVEKKLYGVDLVGSDPVKEIFITSEDDSFEGFLPPTTGRPLCLSIIPHAFTSGATLFLTQIVASGTDACVANSTTWKSKFLLFSSAFTGSESSLSLTSSFTMTGQWIGPGNNNYLGIDFKASYVVPYVSMYSEEGVEEYRCAVGMAYYNQNNYTWWGLASFFWGESGDITMYKTSHSQSNSYYWEDGSRAAYSQKLGANLVGITGQTSPNPQYYSPEGDFLAWCEPNDPVSIPSSYPNGKYLYHRLTPRSSPLPLNVVGEDSILFAFTPNTLPAWVPTTANYRTIVTSQVEGLPTNSRVFVDAAQYLKGKNMFFVFVGTGILFSRDLAPGSWGYLDTTPILGTITQFGYLDYSIDDNILYLLGQDSGGIVKLAKMELNTLYNYSNNGTWLPLIAADGVPAYIKAVGNEDPTPPVEMVPTTILSWSSISSPYSQLEISLNGEILNKGTFTRNLNSNGKFRVGVHRKFMSTTSSYSEPYVLKINNIATTLINCNWDGWIYQDFEYSEWVNSDGLSLTMERYT